MRVALVSPDLLFGSRIASLVESAGAELQRIDHPGDLPLPEEVSVVLVDWAYRTSTWAQLLHSWAANSSRADSPPRVVLFGPHTDLTAHAEARSGGLGPMWARSRLLADLPQLLAQAAGRA